MTVMIKEQLTIACYQQDIVWEQPTANFRRVEEAFAALGTEADILVVPETFTTGFSDNMADMAEPPEGQTFRFALSMARRHDALFVGTWTVAIADNPRKVVNRLHWVKPDGTYGYYDKGHTFRMSTEAAQLERGTRREVFEWRGWRIKPAVCYDLRFPKWLRTSNPPDYDLLLLCANWPASRHEAWSTLLRARAIENLCYVAGVNRVGTDGVDIPYAGYSAVVNYKGQDMATLAAGAEGVVCATLDSRRLEAFRQHWPFFLDFD